MLQNHLESIFASAPQEQTLQDILVSARLRKGFSQSEASSMIGINNATWSRFEKGSGRSLGDDKILDACTLLEIDPHRVFFLMGRIHPDLHERLLADWDLYNGVREAIGL